MTSIKDVWTLANSILHASRQIVNAALKPLHLSSAEGNVLLHLLMQREEVSQEQLGEKLDIGKAAISRAVDSLEEKGYVVRQRRVDDKRAYRLQLTEKAHAIGPRLEAAYDLVYQTATQGISPEGFAQVLALLAHVSKNLTEYREEE